MDTVEVLAIFGTNDYFEWAIVNEMEPRGILGSKAPAFRFNPTHFEPKMHWSLSESREFDFGIF